MLINIADIDTQFEYKNDADKISSLCVRAFKKNIKIYISKEDFEANKEYFYYHTTHKLFRPKYVYQKKTIRQIITENNLKIKVSTVRDRIKRGWTYEEAINTPVGDRRPTYESMAKRRAAMVSHKKTITYQGTKDALVTSGNHTNTLAEIAEYSEEEN